MSYLTQRYEMVPPILTSESHQAVEVLCKFCQPIYSSFLLERRGPLWGLTLSLWNHVLLVGHVRNNVFAQWSSHSPLSIYSNCNSNSNTNTNTMSQELLLLLPGDCILSINGRPTCMFSNLTMVTDYVKACHTLHLIVLRAQEPSLNMDHVRMSLQCNQIWPLIADFYKQHSHSLPSPPSPPPPSHSKPISQQSLHKRPNIPSQSRKPQSELQTPPLTNPMFQIPFLNVSDEEYSAKHYIRQINAATFQKWLTQRKLEWKRQWKKITKTDPPTTNPQPILCPIITWAHPYFLNGQGAPLDFEDELDIDEINTSQHYLTSITATNFSSWLKQRKKQWAQRYKVRLLECDEMWDFDNNDTPSTISLDFWSFQGYSSLEQWLADSKSKWRLKYSWNIRKRKTIQEESQQIVSFPSTSTTCTIDDDQEEQFKQWLRVRKNQWRIQRRKRQRLEEANVPTSPRCIISSTLVDMVHIDALLEEERAKDMAKQKHSFDLSFVFDAKLGACDDVIAHCFHFLSLRDHGTMLCISQSTSILIQERHSMWRQLCPTTWTLPRKPRKPWHDFYLSKMKKEVEDSRKRSDDILQKATLILAKGDFLQKMEKLVIQAQRLFGFDINYSSGVVGERNSILNLAVIHRRPKVVKWLVELKDVDLETSDRGGFTPLINAAWAGDRGLVRLLLAKGCDRTRIGTGHYTQPLALPDFKGLTSEGWAKKQGHEALSNLIRLGL